MMLIDYKRELESQIAGYRELVKQRRSEMERLFEWQRDLAEKLDVTVQELEEVHLPSEEELDELRGHLEVLQNERNKRAELFLNTHVETKDIMEKLQMKPQNKFEHIAVTSLSVDFKVTDLNMDRLSKLRQGLEMECKRTNNMVQELHERLTKLGEYLEKDQIYPNSFLQSHQGCHQETDRARREMIRRIKKQKLQERTNKLLAGKQALTPNTLSRSYATSPLEKRNRTAAGLPATAEKNRRVSGRLVARAMVDTTANAERKLDYGNENSAKKPLIVGVSGSILKHKRTSGGKRQSAGRKSLSKHMDTSVAARDPLQDTTLLTTYTDSKDNINEKAICCSLLGNSKGTDQMIPIIVVESSDEEKFTPSATSKEHRLQ